MSTNEPVNIELREKLLTDAMNIRDYCSEHRETMHVCGCPFNVDGCCALHYNYPDSWPDLRGMAK